jgi:predicted amidohydrolase YtcJ
MVYVAYAVFAIFGATACTPVSDSGAPATVFYNGKIATVNASFEMVEAVAVTEGRIVAVGSSADVQALASNKTRLVDLGGKTVLPGFYDNHVHLSMGSSPNPYALDLWEATTLDEVLTAIREKTAEVPKGEWIRVELAYTTNIPHPFPEKKAPTRWDLDEAAPDHPVMLTRGAHLTVVNSLGLREANITKDTKVPGGVVDLDADGELTGKLREGPARKLITRVMPPTPRREPEEAKAGLRRFLEGLLAVGITSVNAAGVQLTSPDQWRLIQDTYAEFGETLPRLTVQARLSPGYDRFDDLETSVETTIRELESMPFHTGFGNDRLKVGAIKMSIDGAYSGPTSWLLPPYPREDYEASIRIPEEALYPVAKRGHELGWQLGIHCIGDGAIQMCVDVMERILDESPRDNARPYIHHYTVLPPEETLQKTAELGITVASQPNWVYSKMQFAPDIVSGERLETSQPQQSLIDHGIRVSYGSDGMPHGPMYGVYGAVTRKSSDGNVYGPGERVSLEQAIRSYTLETAYMTFDEENRGSLEVGKFADMIVLAEDIFTVDPERIKDIGIEQAIIGGEVIHATTTPARPFQQIDHPW